MKRRLSAVTFVLVACALVAWAALPLLARGQCPNGRCPLRAPVVVGPLSQPAPVAQPPAPSVEWRFREDRPGEAYLYVNGRQAGGLRTDGVWMPITAADEWGPGVKLFPGIRTGCCNCKSASGGKGTCGSYACPASGGRGPCPCDDADADAVGLITGSGAGLRNYGMDWRPGVMQRQKERVTISGQEVSPDLIRQALAGGAAAPEGPRRPQPQPEPNPGPSPAPAPGPNGGLVDDSQWLNVVVTGAEADRKKVLQDLDTHPALAAWKGKVKVQGYEPTHWAAKDLKSTVSPTIDILAPGGTALERMEGYEGPEALAINLTDADSRLRDPKPFDPNKVPDASKQKPVSPVSVGGVDLAQYPGVLALAGGSVLVGLHLLLRRKA